MKPINFLFQTLILIFFLSNSTLSQWIKTGGPAGGNVDCMTISNNNIYIGTGFGVFKSTNGGLNWVQLPGIQDAESIASKGDTIWAGAWNNRLYKSTDAGNNWSYSGLQGGSITNIFTFGNKLFVSAYDLYVSSDFGNTWEMTSFQSDWVSCNTIKDNIIYIGSHNNGVFISADTGKTWNQVNNGFNQTYCFALEKKDNFVFAGIYGNGNGIYKTSNNGNNWYQCNNGLNLLGITDINNSNGILYTSIWGAGIYSSSDNGNNWNEINNGIGDEKNFHTIKSKGDTIYAGSAGNGMFSTTNLGQVWNQIDNGLSIQQINSVTAKGIYLFASARFAGIFRSSDEGITWEKKNNGMDFWESNPICVNGNYVYVGTEGGIYKSSTYGENWQWMGRPTYNGFVSSIQIFNNTIYAGNNNMGGLYMSNDSGNTWQQIGLNNCDVNSLLLSDSIFVVGVIDWINSYGIYRSTNHGVTWVGAFPNHAVTCLLKIQNDIYAGATAGSVGVYKSTNNGQSWYLSGLTNHSIYSLIDINGNIFASADNGIYLTSNNGSSWVNVTENLSNTEINSLCNFNNYLYAGTIGNSVWKRSLSELIGINKNSTNIPTSYNLFQNYPNPFNPVTKIKFSIPSVGTTFQTVQLKIYDILGREIAILVNEHLKPGTYEVEFDGSGYSSGIYFYKLTAGEFTETKRMILVK